MRGLKTLSVLSVTLSMVCGMILETNSTRSVPPPINITIENVPSPTLDSNISTTNVLDVRTPPQVQNQIKEKISSKYSIETSHAGIAIPVEDEVEEITKKMNFYKLERPTTANGGLSTWILLSGQSTTKKPIVKPVIMKDERSSETLILSEKPALKPIFKRRSTTLRPTTTSSETTTTVRINTFSPSSPTKLTKVKASLLRNITTTTTTAVPIITELTTTHKASEALPIEAKDGDLNLPSTSESSKKNKKIQKKKKNKPQRRKPNKSSKEGNNKLKEEEDSPGTQLYSYLRSEIIPVTVGVSLVGLLVTAGLASYYFQPFAALRRSDPIDHKDTDGSYYYQDSSYSNAMPEEEAIGKVIAGMPDNALQDGGVSYKQPTSRNTYPQNVRYRHVDRRSQIYMNPYGSVEDVKLHDRTVATTSYEGDYKGGNDKFVVEVTPAVVPEHGPRNIKEEEGRKFVVGNIPKEFFSSAGASPRNIRMKREILLPDDSENEIEDEEEVVVKQTTTENVNEITTELITTEENPKESTPHNVSNPNETTNTLFELFSDLFKLKVKLGLELIKNITNSVSTYVSTVHTRLDQHYRKATRWNQ
ncbi:uncharacterized protein [Euwallacea fornicatus]|uniref:uncharacterized protein n=1 Tax=Euwallacea fornicatus TaxID=995702 RepID=UPI00338F6E8B